MLVLSVIPLLLGNLQTAIQSELYVMKSCKFVILIFVFVLAAHSMLFPIYSVSSLNSEQVYPRIHPVS